MRAWHAKNVSEARPLRRKTRAAVAAPELRAKFGVPGFLLRLAGARRLKLAVTNGSLRRLHD